MIVPTRFDASSAHLDVPVKVFVSITLSHYMEEVDGWIPFRPISAISQLWRDHIRVARKGPSVYDLPKFWAAYANRVGKRCRGCDTPLH